MDGVIICTPFGSYRLTGEFIDDHIYPVNLRQKIERLKRKSKVQEIEKMEQPINKTHRCENMPTDIHLDQRYLPTEISWELGITIGPNYSQDNSAIIRIKENITHCPYCGIKLSRDFN